jgi:hypothetical protein
MKKHILFLGFLLFSAQALSDSYSTPLDQLSKKFQGSFQEALDKEKSRLINCPIITQDLLSMTLHANNDLQLRFVMKKELFKLVAEMSHIPITIHTIADKNDWQFTDNLFTELTEYKNLLQETARFFEKSDLDPVLKDRIKNMIDISCQYLSTILINHVMHKDSYTDYALHMRPYIAKNLEDGAKTLIEQFNNQIKIWQTNYPNEQWSCLKIAILGTHDPREGYVLKQYFQWLLKEPGYEKNVIYVEYPEVNDIISDKTKSTKQAINALINNSYQQKIGLDLMGEPSYMQRDVMSEPAKYILQNMPVDLAGP